MKLRERTRKDKTRKKKNKKLTQRRVKTVSTGAQEGSPQTTSLTSRISSWLSSNKKK